MKQSRTISFYAAACLFLAGQALMAHDPHDPYDVVAVSPNFVQDQTIFAASSGLVVKFDTYGLLRSTDGGATWSVVPNIQNNDTVRAILFSPSYATDQTIFVVGHSGLFKTTDQGATWTHLTTKALRSGALSPNYAKDQTLYLATAQNAITKSTNGGLNFAAVGAPTLTATVDLIAISPNFTLDQTLLLGGGGNDGIFESTNAGTSWVPVTTGMRVPVVTSIVFSPAFGTDHTVYATSLGAGVLKSTNRGSTWASSNSGLTDLNASSMALSGTYLQDSTIFLTTGVAGVFQSTNAASSWTLGGTVSRKLSDLTTVHYQTIAAAGTGSAPLLYLGMFEGLWTSTHGISNWTYVDSWPPRLIRHINLSPTYTQDQTVFAATYGGGNLWSTDGGTTWSFQNTGMQEAYIDSAQFSPNYATDGIVFSSCSKGLQRSDDRGATWIMMQGLGITDYPRGLAVSPNFSVDNTVLIGTKKPSGGFYSGLWLSTDQGNTWQQTTLTGEGVVSIAMSPGWATDRTAFAASPDAGLYKTTDGTATWTLINTFPPNTGTFATVAISPNYPTDKTVLAVPIDKGLYRSTDGGTTWTLLPGTASLRPLEIRFSPNYANDQTFFAGTLHNGLVKFTKGGNSFVTIKSFPDSWVSAVGLSPTFASDQTMFASGYWGLYKSTDGGKTWTYTAEPYRVEEFREVASRYAPQNPPSITYTGNWSFPEPEANASSYEWAQTQDSSATATFSFYGTGVRWISWTGPGQGSAAISLDGASEGTVNLHAATNSFQQNVYEQHGIPCGPHQFSITPILTAGQTISLDAMDAWVETCPQVPATSSAKPDTEK